MSVGCSVFVVLCILSLYSAVFMSALCIVIVGTLQDICPYNAVLYLCPVLCSVSACSSARYRVCTLQPCLCPVLLVLVLCVVQCSFSVLCPSLHCSCPCSGVYLSFALHYFCPEAAFHVCTPFLSSCLYSGVFYLHVCTLLSATFIFVYSTIFISMLCSSSR
jgi:hypothetical protein